MLARRPRRWPLPSMTTCKRQKQLVSRTVGWFLCREAVPAAQFSMVRRMVVCSSSCFAVFQPPESTSYARSKYLMHRNRPHHIHPSFASPRRRLATGDGGASSGQEKGWGRRDCTHDLLEGGHFECVSTSSRRELWKGRRGNQRLLREDLSWQLGRPVKLVFVGGWVGMGQHTGFRTGDSGCRFAGENWESTTTNFSPSRFEAVRDRHWPESSMLISQDRAGTTHVIRASGHGRGWPGTRFFMATTTVQYDTHSHGDYDGG